MFRYSFILKMRNYIEGVLLHRNVNSESIILICGHYKTGMCLACPKECRNTVHIIHKCQLYQALPQQKSEGRVPRVCNLGHAASWVIGSKSHSKHVSDDMSTCKQMYMKSRLHCFEVNLRAPITQKIGRSVPNGVRSRLVKFSTVGGPSFAVVVLRKHSKTPQSTQRINKFH